MSVSKGQGDFGHVSEKKGKYSEVMAAFNAESPGGKVSARLASQKKLQEQSANFDFIIGRPIAKK